LQSDPATRLPILFTAVFSEPVAGLDRQTISLAGSTADITNAFVSVNAINAFSYTIEVSGVRSPGQIVVSLPARAAYDLVLNYSSAAISSDNNVNFQPNIIGVTVSGRVRRNLGVIRTPSTVTLTNNLTGEIWTTRTNRSGFYHFFGLKIYEQIGSRFSVKIDNKSFVYNLPQPLTITSNRTNLNYIVP
jgi:hypothetical protein